MLRSVSMQGGLSLVLLVGVVDAQAQISTAVRGKDPVFGAGSELAKFRAGNVSDAAGERIVFRGTVRDDAGSRQGIVRADASGNGTMIAERDAASPSSSTYRNFLQPAINSTGDVTWFAFLGDGRSGIFRTLLSDPLIDRVVAVEGSSAPIGAYRFSDFDTPEISETGAVVFWARAADTMSSNVAEGIFVCQGGDGDCTTGSGTASVLARDGNVVDGRELCEFAPSLNVSVYGVTFLATTRSDCSDPSGTLEGVFRVDFAGSVGIETIALAGNLTDIGDGDTYQRFRDTPSIEDDGIVAFRADTSTSEAVFRCAPGAGCPSSTLPTSFVEKGQLHDGSELRRFAGPRVSNNGDVVFQARPRGGTAVGRTLYVRRSGGAIERIVTGTQALDDVGGATFRR
ncbi:MAG TPA: hypothetical protein VFO62_08980, partial [Candidatus Binatia bacterium]|nr:hypothetical protein [Candidatus Binatia bacterium]